MRLKLGPLASAVAGSIGGGTYQRGRTGTVVRTKPLPRVQRSSSTSTARQRFAAAMYAWRSLSPSERTAWSDFASTQPWFNRFGDPVTASGFMAFMRINSPSYTAPGETYTKPLATTPPTDTTSTLPANLSALYYSGTGELLVFSSDGAVAEGTDLLAFASAPLPALRQYSGASIGNAPFIGSITQTFALPYNLGTQVLARYPTLASLPVTGGLWLRLQAVNATSGWPGLSATFPVPVTP